MIHFCNTQDHILVSTGAILLASATDQELWLKPTEGFNWLLEYKSMKPEMFFTNQYG